VKHFYPDTPLTSQEWNQTVADFKGLCAYCQEREYQLMEHFIAQSKGGVVHVGNCLPACSYCNKRKSDLTGVALIGLFGDELIGTLKGYLESRSGLVIEWPNDSPVYEPGVRICIKEVAEAKGMKQYELAEKSGVTEQLLNRYWNNHTQSVSLRQLAMIAKALEVAPGDLIEVLEDQEEIDPAA
jgi:DNA-binding Xre family transcriptional regulator